MEKELGLPWSGRGELFCRVCAPESPRGALAIVHGYGEHSGRYREFARWLAARGWLVAACDLPGHGKSPGRRGHIRSFSDYLAAVKALLAEVRRAVPAPVFLLGHSLGGLIAARYLQLQPGAAAGLILSSPFFGLAMPVPAWKRTLARMLSRLCPAASLPSGIRPEDLSHDPEVVEAYRGDPLVHRAATARWFTEVLAAQAAALREAEKIQVPLLIIQGEEDRLAEVAATRRFVARSRAPDLTFRLYAGLYHETLNEVGKERVWQEVLDWLEAWGGGRDG